MNAGTISLAGWGFALAALAHAGLAVILGRRQATQPSVSARLLLLAVVLTVLWCVLQAALLLGRQPWALAVVRPLEWLRVSAWIAWIVAMLVPESRLWPRGGAGLLSALAGGAIAATAWPVLGAAADGVHSAQRLGLGFMLLAILALTLLEQMLRGLAPHARWGAKPAGMALLAMFGFDLYMYSKAALFGSIDGHVFAVRGYVEAAAAPLIWMSMARGDEWLARLRLSQNAAFHSLAVVFVGLYLLFVSGVGYYVRYFGGEWGPALQQGMVFFALVVLVGLALSGAIRARLRVFLSKNFFRYRYDYREEWLKFTQVLSSQGTPQGMGQQVVRGLADLVESPAGGLWIRTASTGAYGQIAQWNMASLSATEPDGSALVEAMRPQGLVVNVHEWRGDPLRYGGGSLPAWLTGLERAWLVVPLRGGPDLVGFVVLMEPRTRFDLNWEVYDLLKAAGRQAAAFLAHVMATEALLEARKFDAFNRMSAFVVHDLKNIVAQLSLMMKNAKRLQGNVEFQQDMLMTVENSLEKMRQLMVQLREGVSATDGASGVNLEQILQHSQQMAGAQGRDLVVRARQSLRARGSAQRLERVIGHWIQNAIDATVPGQDLWVELVRVGSYAKLVVGDGGKGMTAEFVRDELFRPFSSTKGSGMGIGAYECQQYLQELGGKISVQSTVGTGTRVELLLPLLDLPTQSDLDILKAAP